MAIEKSLYEAPMGMGMLAEIEPSELEIEIVNPEMVTLDDGSVEITLMPGGDEEDGLDQFDTNIAEHLDEGALQELASDLIGLVDADVTSRKDWADTFAKGLEVLGFKYEERTQPWDGACGVYSTVLSEAAIRFQAEAMSETFPAAGPVKTKILGKVTKEKEESASRVREDMNYMLTEKMVEYRPEHERMLFSLGLAGSAFKKVYFDPSLGRPTAVYIPAEDVIVPYGTAHIEVAERVTHQMRKTKIEVDRLMASGFYREVELGEPVTTFTDLEKKKAQENGYVLTNDNRYTLYEIHVETCIPGVDDDDEDSKQVNGEPLAKPYVITIDKGTQTVLSIRRNWDPEDPLTFKRNHFVH